MSHLMDLISGTEHLFAAMLIINLAFMCISSKIPNVIHSREDLMLFIVKK